MFIKIFSISCDIEIISKQIDQTAAANSTFPPWEIFMICLLLQLLIFEKKSFMQKSFSAL